MATLPGHPCRRRLRIGLALVLLAAAGCQSLAYPWKTAGSDRIENRHLSLVEIGERSLELGERLEEQNLYVGALEAYRRAEWAFNYLQRLSGQTPLLLEDARASRQRVETKLATP